MIRSPGWVRLGAARRAFLTSWCGSARNIQGDAASDGAGGRVVHAVRQPKFLPHPLPAPARPPTRATAPRVGSGISQIISAALWSSAEARACAIPRGSAPAPGVGPSADGAARLPWYRYYRTETQLQIQTRAF